MNKQGLLEEIVKLDIEVSENFPHYDLVDKEVVLALINQLEEPEKVVIPHFVANWIEEFSLQGSNPLKVYEELSKDFSEGWTTDEDARVYHWISRNSKNTDCFIDSLRYGYEIERND